MCGSIALCPVSYTHLDVYKRQPTSFALPKSRISQAKSSAGPEVSLSTSITVDTFMLSASDVKVSMASPFLSTAVASAFVPVSYTHLDVYKRQNIYY